MNSVLKGKIIRQGFKKLYFKWHLYQILKNGYEVWLRDCNILRDCGSMLAKYNNSGS